MNVKPARRRLILVGEQPAEQALLAQRLVAGKPLFERGKRLGGIGLRRIGLDRAGGNQRLILRAERGGVGRQHGPLSASSEQKLQAVNWCWGYANATRHTRLVRACALGRVSSTPQPLGPISGVSGILDHPLSRMMTAVGVTRTKRSRTQRVGILDHIRPAAGGGAG
jgi:hypothetical protein